MDGELRAKTEQWAREYGREEWGRLVAECERLRELLRQYGRHQEGCTGQWPAYRCRCGWRDVEPEFTQPNSQYGS